MVADVHVTGQQGGVGDGNAMSDAAVVSDMATHHQETFVADFREGPRPGAAVNGDVLPDHRARTNPYARLGRGIEMQILRIVADDRKRMHDDALSKDDAAFDDRMRVYDAAGAQLRTLVHEGRRMNSHECRHLASIAGRLQVAVSGCSRFSRRSRCSGCSRCSHGVLAFRARRPEPLRPRTPGTSRTVRLSRRQQVMRLRVSRGGAWRNAVAPFWHGRTDNRERKG